METQRESRQVEKEVQKHRNNWLARRRKSMRNETDEQRDARVERESILHAELETARNRPFINGSQSPRSPVYNPGTPRSPASP